jgi:hypothetical protein
MLPTISINRKEAMFSRRVRGLALSAIVLAIASVPTRAASRSAGVPDVPSNLEVPAGYSLFFKGHAIGTQNYVCLPAASGVAWKQIAPQATLFHQVKGRLVQQLTTHFLSANPDENGLPRPTWQHSHDSSQVWARLSQSSTDPHYVEQGAIPWLLLEAAGTSRGPGGGFVLAQTAYIQRLNTSGGLAPATGCSQTSDIGALVLVPYSADYYFYKAHRRR